MPSFNLLPDGEVAALVGIREVSEHAGQTEDGLIAAMNEMGAGDWKDLAKAAGVWAEAPPPRRQDRGRGRTARRRRRAGSRWPPEDCWPSSKRF